MTAASPLRPLRLDDLVAQAAQRAGSHDAIVAAGGDQLTAVTWSDLQARVSAAAAGFVALGLRPGDRIAVILGNTAEFATAYWGAVRAGAIVVLINPSYTQPEIAFMLADAGVGLAVCEPELVPRVTAAAAEAQAEVTAEFTVVTAEPGWWRAPADAVAPPASPGPPSSGADVAVMCYTSGTTGRPKGAELTHDNLLANLDAFAVLPGLTITSDDVLLGVLPFFHIFGLNVVLNAAARHDATVLVLDRFSPGPSLAAMTAAGVTVAVGAPPMFAGWNAAAAGGAPPPPTLRAALSGADALPLEVWTDFRDRFGLEIHEGYGLTETAPVLTSTAASPLPRAGTVGHAIPGVELRLRPLDRTVLSGDAVENDGIGEICARGPNVFAGYHHLPDTTRAAFAGGWFLTGDLGRFDDQGNLEIVGRIKDMLIVSGFNVYPREVEAVLTAHPSIAAAVVIGDPDRRTGQRVRAVVVARPGAAQDEGAVLQHCRARLARYKLPRSVEWVDALPTSLSGKVLRRELGQKAAISARGDDPVR